MGSIIALTDMDGQIVETYEYDVFGSPVIRDKFGVQLQNTAVGNFYMFTARQYDPETGNYYYRARYYSANIGRFLQADPIGYDSGINLYTYCYNNPLKYVDSDGQAANLVAGGIGALGGAVIGGGVYAIFHEGDWSWSKFIGATTGGAVTGGLAGLTCGASLVAQAGVAGGVTVGAVSSGVGYVAEWGVSQGVTRLFGEENIGAAKEWSTSEAVGAIAFGGLTGGVMSKFNNISHVRGRWPTTLKTALTGKHAQALYGDIGKTTTAVLGYETGKAVGRSSTNSSRNSSLSLTGNLYGSGK